MKAYRYELRHRPMQLGAQPRGHLAVKNSSCLQPNYNRSAKFGWVYYPEPLLEFDWLAFELRPAGEAELAPLNDYEFQDTDPAYVINN